MNIGAAPALSDSSVLTPLRPPTAPAGQSVSASPLSEGSDVIVTLGGVTPDATPPAAVGPAGSPDRGPSDAGSESPVDRGNPMSAKPGARTVDPTQSLTDEELDTLRQLQARDREVRQHEAAHQAVGGQYAGAVSYSFQRGPDGIAYAVGGEVPIDISPVPGDPQATIEKMRIVRAAAMAPAQPSSQDLQVAAAAAQAQIQAQVELAAAQRDGRVDDATAPSRAAEDSEAEQADGSPRALAALAVASYRAVESLQGQRSGTDSPFARA